MATSMIRVSEETRRAIQELTRGVSTMQEVVARAVEDLRRKEFLERANEEYAALRKDPAAWADEQEERRAWDKTTADGLEAD